MAGTKVSLRLSSAGEAMGTQLRAEPCLDLCSSLQSFRLMILVPHPSPVYSSWAALWISQMLRFNRASWSLSTPTEETPSHEEHTRVFLFTIGEGCGVPETGVEPGVLISSIIILTFSGTLVASLQISSQPGSLDFRKSAHCIQMKRYLSKMGFFIELHKPTA